MPVTAFAVPDAGPLLLVVLGTDSDARLHVRLSAEDAARVSTAGVFGASPELAQGLTAAAAEASDGLSARLRAAPTIGPEPGLGALEASAWLAGDPQRRAAGSWLLAGWDGAAGPVRTIWDYVPLDGAGGVDGPGAAATQSAALQFVLDEHPELPIELADLAAALSALELPGASAPLEELAAVLTGLGVAHERLPDDGPLGFAMGDDQDQWHCLADVVPSGWLVLYVELPESADVHGAARAAAFAQVAGINARLQVGALLLDGDEGQLMYRAATDTASPLGRVAVLRRLLDLVHADVQAVLAAWRDEA